MGLKFKINIINVGDLKDVLYVTRTKVDSLVGAATVTFAEVYANKGKIINIYVSKCETASYCHSFFK